MSNVLLLSFGFVLGALYGGFRSYRLDPRNICCIAESTFWTGVLYSLFVAFPLSSLLLLSIIRYRRGQPFLCLPYIQVSQQPYDLSIGYHFVVVDDYRRGEQNSLES